MDRNTQQWTLSVVFDITDIDAVTNINMFGSSDSSIGTLVGKSGAAISSCYVQKHPTLTSGVTSNCDVKDKIRLEDLISLSTNEWSSASDGTIALREQLFNPSTALVLNFENNPKLEYYMGENFSIAGLTVEARFSGSNDTFEVESFTYDASDYNPLLAGKYTIRVSALGYTTTYEVNVRKINVVGLEVVSKGDKYYETNEIQSSTYDVNYILENGEVIPTTGEKRTDVKYPTLEIKLTTGKYVYGQNLITATCGTLSGSCVVDALIKNLESIKIKQGPTKTTYKANEKFSTAGLLVEATYNDGSVVVVNNADLEIIGELIVAGDNIVIISYDSYKTEEVQVYGTSSYLVEFKNWDGSTISSSTYNENDVVVIPQAPTKASDNVYNYSFKGWDKEVSATATENVVYTAVFEKTYIDYTVEFKNWDGSIISTDTYHYGDTVVAPANPTKQGNLIYNYNFIGWNTSVSTSCTGNATYIAMFEQNYIDYTVEFKNWDGSTIFTKTYHYGDEVMIPENPTKSSDNTYNYTFTGWDKVVPTNVVSNDVYTAVFESNYIDYRVEFKNWDGTTISSKTYHYGDEVMIPENPTRDGYEFISWDKDVSTTVASNEVYTAVYKENSKTYTVEFKNWDGSTISSATYRHGETVVVPANPTKASDNTYTYTFAGWDKDVTLAVANVVYTAVFNNTYIEYLVEFKNWDGSTISSKIYHYGDQVVVPSNPTKASDSTYAYTFTGWDKDVATQVTSKATYVAKFEQSYVEYVVEFINWDGSLVSTAIYHYGDLVTIPENLTKASDKTYTYTFTGWDKTVSTLCVGNTTYKAVFESTFIEYIITFKDWDGSVILESTYHYTDVITIPSNPVREGFAFTGWNTTVSALCIGNVTYTATYMPVSATVYVVTFLNWDNTLLSSTAYYIGDTVVAPTATKPALENGEYVFVGWTPTFNPSCNGTAVYVAQFEFVEYKYTVVFKDWNGTVISQNEYSHGAEVVVPDNPNRDGYTFAGWDKEMDLTCKSDAIYTATYNENPKVVCTITFLNWDNSFIISTSYYAGDMIVPPTNPTRASDNTYDYVFIGWGESYTGICTETKVYIAQFNAEYIEYTVVFKTEDGSVISSNTYHYQDSIVYPEAPTKEGYAFTGWDKNPEKVEENIEITAIFSEVEQTEDQSTHQKTRLETWAIVLIIIGCVLLFIFGIILMLAGFSNSSIPAGIVGLVIFISTIVFMIISIVNNWYF